MLKGARVRKRDGRLEKFSEKKLLHSIGRAFKIADVPDHERAAAIYYEVIHKLAERGEKQVMTVDEIERAVKAVLHKHDLPKVVHGYELVFLRLKPTKIEKVRKRDGRIVDFDPERIFKSICKSFKQTRRTIDKRCESLTGEVIELLDKRYAGQTAPVEAIKETIEFVLVKNKLPDVAKAYSLHRYM